jgi:hypothetical protein
VTIADVVLLVLLGTRGSREVTPYRTLDALLGGVVEARVMVLVLASAMVVLGATDAAQAPGTVSGVPYLAELRTALGTSTIGSVIAESAIPVVGTIPGPLLPGLVAGSMR